MNMPPLSGIYKQSITKHLNFRSDVISCNDSLYDCSNDWSRVGEGLVNDQSNGIDGKILTVCVCMCVCVRVDRKF